MAVSKKIKQFMEQGSWIRRMFEEGIVLKQQYGERTSSTSRWATRSCSPAGVLRRAAPHRR